MTAWTDFLLARGALLDGAMVAGFGDSPGELVAARDAAVVCDLGPVGALTVTGADAASFLQGQFTSDVAALAPGAWQLSAWCSPKGRVLANFTLGRTAEDVFALLLPRILLDPVHRRLAMFVLRAKVAIADATETAVRIGIGGPAAAQCVAAIAGSAPAVYGSTPIQGGTAVGLDSSRFIAIVEPVEAPSLWHRLHTARAAGFPCWRWLAIRGGVPVILPPTQDQFVPQMLNLDALGGVSFHKGCYTGQEIVARTQYRGRLKERLAMAHADTAPAPGTRLYAAAFGDQPCGTVINAGVAPGGGADLLLVAQLTAIAARDLRTGAQDGSPLTLLPLPYPVPTPAAAQGRIA